MSNLTKLDFAALEVSGNNYLPWILDAEIHLDAMGLGDTVKPENNASLQDRAKAMIFLRHHIHEGLKCEYLTVKDPQILWNSLRERYDHQRTVILPRARHEWSHLRFQDFKSVSEYNSALFSITSQLKLCGQPVTEEDMLEKTYSTFHRDNIVLQEQYRQCRYQKYSALISVLLVAEQHNKLLMKNHESRPTGSAPMPEAHAAVSRDRGRGRGPRRGQRRGNGRGRGRHNYRERYEPYHQQWNVYRLNENKEKGLQNKPRKQYEDSCYRCGMKGHWSRTCRTPKHLVDLYQASVKDKGKNAEMNFNDIFESESPVDLSGLEVSDFFEDPDGRIDHLIGDGTVSTN